jgi:hypothetical protein
MPNLLSKCYLVRGVYEDERGKLDAVYLLVNLNGKWEVVWLTCQPGRDKAVKNPWGVRCYRYRRFRKAGRTFIGFKEPPPAFLKPLLCPGEEWSLLVESHPSRVQPAVREWARQVNSIHGGRNG